MGNWTYQWISLSILSTLIFITSFGIIISYMANFKNLRSNLESLNTKGARNIMYITASCFLLTFVSSIISILYGFGVINNSSDENNSSSSSGMSGGGDDENTTQAADCDTTNGCNTANDSWDYITGLTYKKESWQNIDNTLDDYVVPTTNSYTSCDVSLNACVPPETEGKCLKNGQEPVHICTMQTLGSKQMQNAAINASPDSSGNDSTHVFGIVGFDGSSTFGEISSTGEITSCGNCYEICFAPYFNSVNSQESAGEENGESNNSNGIISSATMNVSNAQKDYRSNLNEYNGKYGRNMIVQNFNKDAGGSYSMDIFMPAGGFGAYNSCVTNGADASGCGGDDFDGTTTTKISDFVYTNYPTVGQGWSGGIRGGAAGGGPDEPVDTMTESDIYNYCDSIQSNGGTDVDALVVEACKWVYDNNYHYNGYGMAIRRVQCPKDLSYVTGCSKNNANYPEFTDGNNSPFTDLGTTGTTGSYSFNWSGNNTDSDNGWRIIDIDSGNRFKTTTMQDCCQPSCTRASNFYDETGDEFYDENNKYFYGCNKYDQILGEIDGGFPTDRINQDVCDGSWQDCSTVVDTIPDCTNSADTSTNSEDTSTNSADTTSSDCVADYGTCGGENHTGFTNCCSSTFNCEYKDQYYSQCRPSS